MTSSSKDYTHGRIYKILNYIDDACYVGSTCQPLAKRMAAHRYNAIEAKKRHLPLYMKMNEYGHENFYIELIEAYPCGNSEELRKREGQFIREFGTLNNLIAGRTSQENSREYHQNNRETILARKKEYREANRERLKMTYTCVCGSTCRIDIKSRHERTSKHQTFITNLDAPTQTES